MSSVNEVLTFVHEKMHLSLLNVSSHYHRNLQNSCLHSFQWKPVYRDAAEITGEATVTLRYTAPGANKRNLFQLTAKVATMVTTLTIQDLF